MSGEHTHPEVDALDQALAGLSDRVSRLTAQMVALEAAAADADARLDRIAQEVTSMATWHAYSGKPDGTLTVRKSDGYVRLDADVADPPRDGVEMHLVYLNCALDWASGGTDGTIRLRYTREDGDDTAYQDFAVNNKGAIGNPDRFLITHTHFEAGKAGIGGRWWVRCSGDLDSIKIGTRYVKIALV